MKPTQRLAIIAVPLLIIAVAFFFHQKADAERLEVEKEVQRLDRQVLLENGEARLEAERNAEFAREEEDAILAQMAFWAFAIGLGVLFFILSCAFVIAERRHAQKRDELIASFSEELENGTSEAPEADAGASVSEQAQG